ncbi:t-box transcription factor TBX20 [Trichonephila clavipes]|nr:t-box transcription factor TBX20 [Trichonephila clavipes]
MVERTSQSPLSPVSLLSPGGQRCATSPELTPSDTDTGPLVDDDIDKQSAKISEDNFDLSSKDSVDSIDQVKPVKAKSDKKKEKADKATPIVGKCNCEELKSVEAHLETKDLWEKFHGLGTEMIITKSGSIIGLSDCRSALEATKEGKMGYTQEINSLLFSIGALGGTILRWIPAHVDIEGNEKADSLADEARALEPVTLSIAVFDTNAVTTNKLRLKGHEDSAQWFQIICGMQALPRHATVDPKHLFSCLSIVGAFFKIDNDCSMDILYSDHAMDVATAVINAFSSI